MSQLFRIAGLRTALPGIVAICWLVSSVQAQVGPPVLPGRGSAPATGPAPTGLRTQQIVDSLQRLTRPGYYTALFTARKSSAPSSNANARLMADACNTYLCTGPATPLSVSLTSSGPLTCTVTSATLTATSTPPTGGTYAFAGPDGAVAASGNTAVVTKAGTYTVTFSKAGSQPATATATVSATPCAPANTAPVATANANQRTTERTPFSYTVAAFTDAETPNSLTYAATIDPANVGLSFDPATRVISGTPGTPGSVSVTVTAIDPGGLSATTSFTIDVIRNVGSTPLRVTLTASPTTILTTGTTTLSATASGGTPGSPPSRYTYNFSGPGNFVTSGDGRATVSDLPAGVQTFTVVVADATQPVSQTTSATVSVTVNPANSAPVATANTNQTATVGTRFAYTVNAFTDAETPNTLTYAASINPANGFAFDPATRVISGTPTAMGVSSVTITATDPGSLSASATFTITVNAAPVGGTTQLTVLQRDPDNGQLGTNTLKPYLQLRNDGTTAIPYSEITVRYWLTLEEPAPLVFQVGSPLGNNNVLLSYRPVSPVRQNADGYIEYRFTAGAGSLPGGGNSGDIQTSVRKENYSGFNQGNDYSYVINRDFAPNPRITAYRNGQLIYGTEPGGVVNAPLTVTLTASPTTILTTGTTTLSATAAGGTAGSPAGPYRYSFSGPGTISVSGNTATVSGLSATVHTFTVMVTDLTAPTNQTISASVSVTVQSATNTAPVATANANQTATVGARFSYTVNAFTDSDGNALTYRAIINPANGLTFDPVTRVIAGTPTATGVSSVTITATDPGSLSASATFTITVNAAPVGGTTQLTVLQRDPDNGQLGTNTLKPYLQLRNDGTAAIPYSEITVRYWLTLEEPAPVVAQVGSQLGNGNVSVSYVPVSPVRQGADGYLLFSFTPGAGSLPGGGNSGDIQTSVRKENYSGFNQGNDYSYVLNRDFAPNPRITAYRNGTLIYGTEPPLSARLGAEAKTPLRVRVLGNPVQGGPLIVEIEGAAGERLRLQLTDLTGRVVSERQVAAANGVERQTLSLEHQPAGVFLLRVSTPTQSQTVKVLRQ